MQDLPLDIQEFLDQYPEARDDHTQSKNVEFYSNRLRCRPDNLLIEEIHKLWLGEYDKLEYKHGYIQWLFPIREYGMNYESQPLQLHELEALRQDPDAINRLIDSYKLMLDFYGMRLVSVETGQVDRALPPRNYAPRYKNLLRSSHNNLRISRILKCLSEFGLERLNAGFLLHVLNEQSEWKELNSPVIRGSMDRWWGNCLRNAQERAWIQSTIAKVRAGDDFVFTRETYERVLGRRLETGRLDGDGDEGSGGNDSTSNS
ncbi:hypothetical protein D9757_010339 [Collybiopsis confluens]|uniref:Opioid growth factor receptor (OGFr) conserved domain-containing protein n=1 Tax=Collybiopsis confluens TaxID=2823264 RepID=A0A8H5GMR7_9AGAR|nr:hypothetical protein D9757_010339 [Collybiopsis confluens]